MSAVPAPSPSFASMSAVATSSSSTQSAAARPPSRSARRSRRPPSTRARRVPAARPRNLLAAAAVAPAPPVPGWTTVPRACVPAPSSARGTARTPPRACGLWPAVGGGVSRRGIAGARLDTDAEAERHDAGSAATTFAGAACMPNSAKAEHPPVSAWAGSRPPLRPLASPP
eukprot:6191679-Pleurochrysis_carterae.AAC.3